MASKLELIGIEQRNSLLPKNYYQVGDNKYGVTHHRALSDDGPSPEHGRGSGGQFDIENYAGVGTITDILGNPTILGSGRNQAFAMNQYNYLEENQYKKPDTSGNVGQWVFDW